MVSLCIHGQDPQQGVIKMANLSPTEDFQLLRGKALQKCLIYPSLGEANSLPELTESCDVDGLGIFSFEGKKIQQGGGKLGKHLEEGFREGPSNTVTKQLNQPPLLFVSALS